MDDITLGAILDDLTRHLGAAGVTWSLGGSASRRVRGFDRAPRDVDVLVAADAAPVLRSTLGDLTRPGHGRPDAWRSAWLLVWRHPSGHDVEFIGGGAVVLDGAVVDLPAEPADRIDWRGRAVPVSRPEVWDALQVPTKAPAAAGPTVPASPSTGTHDPGVA